MLVLSRKLHEQIVLGNDITITVCKIVGNRVTIGIVAPPELNIRRAEVPAKPKEAAADGSDAETKLTGVVGGSP